MVMLMVLFLVLAQALEASVHPQEIALVDWQKSSVGKGFLESYTDFYTKRKLKDILSSGKQLILVCSFDTKNNQHFQWYDAQAFLKKNYGQSATTYLQQASLNNEHYDHKKRLIFSYALYMLKDGKLSKQSELVRDRDVKKYSSPLLTGGFFATVILGFLSVIRF